MIDRDLMEQLAEAGYSDLDTKYRSAGGPAVWKKVQEGVYFLHKHLDKPSFRKIKTLMDRMFNSLSLTLNPEKAKAAIADLEALQKELKKDHGFEGKVRANQSDARMEANRLWKVLKRL